MFPNLLFQIVKFLQANPIALSKQSRDGRINSAFNEDEIFNLLESHFDINRPNMRDWVDFSFEEKSIFYPINIKVSTTKTTDNLNCKLGIYYALTGKIPPFGNGVSWECYFKSLKENIQENTRDYYFLIINKDNPSDVFATSLKSLESVLPNGNNLPFQAKWDNNRNIVIRDFESAKSFLLGTFEQSLSLRAEAYFHFRRYFYEA
ncbi:restriction endonuclease [Helicobacter sp. MIT 14-3879]|uniref:restriction endonuclease n=1 Tax=Helicobacter sp. MIT 14-3879 TaxID=2040649 RepID=UPI000E1FAFDD|nr:restriction endonuclease [Helicobacter sp. MIT 14-3879]RDU59107.1 restriction endonuclease [Helicobacter sp. MIT 14-3879]